MSTMKVGLPPGDRRSQYILEELGRWTGLGFEFLPGDGPQVVIEAGDHAVALEPVVDLTTEAASALLSARFLEGHPPESDVHGLALIFHVLSGADENDPALRDIRERYDDRAGLLGRLGLTDTLVVDALAEDLLALLRQRWPAVGTLNRRVELHLSHDVDAPYLYAFSGLRGLAKAALADVRESDVRLSALSSWMGSVSGKDDADPYFLFDWLMDESEGHGLASTFYFIAGRTGGRLDGDYDLRSPRMRRLLSRVIDRGHNIGLHPSYNAFRSLEVLRVEKARLLDSASDAGWSGSEIPVRMHYLRFDPAITPGLLDQVGFSFDSSLGFAGRAGFRRGTAREFRIWDWSSDRPTSLREKPLTAMDASLYKPDNEGLNPDQAVARLADLTDRIHASGGGVNLLWHNNFFFSAGHKAAYQSIVRRAVGSPYSQADS